ncbi:uncharacterized protein LOC124292286 [Haliotis rubra]|uniref:uncharacterized protein LOC124292286 n=1 Tax=Haliotis rubra TaxID=36100 RepID=UPI001EE580AD|nr:uncharacterized protein LOC124292286 [Haliotis rubra]
MEGVVATRGRSNLAVSADGEVSVNREVTMTALAHDEEGNVFLRVFRARTRQVVGQVSGIFAISGSEEESAPSRHHSVTMPDDDDDIDKMSVKVCVCIFSLIFGSLPVAMIVVGILDYNLCPGNTRLAIYMIAQGATSVVIPILASCWFCCRCISGNFIGAICVIIGLFNIGWGIVGSLWLASSPCKDTLLFTHALGFSVPMWIFYCLVPLLCVCCVRAWCKGDD